jgi:sugar phosphate isomerase/epimerase
MSARAAVIAALLAATAPGAAAAGAANPFFPFCIDWHDAQKRTYEEQAVMLKELGYEGVGHIWLDGVGARSRSLDAQGLRLFQISVKVSLAPGDESYDRRFGSVVKLVQGRGVQFCVLMDGMKPSDPSGDPRAVAIVREMADQARDAGAQLVLYPHTGQWLETLEDAVRVAREVDRPNVGVMFNLCHWLRVSRDRDYRTRLQKALPLLWAVSINGADEHDDGPGWAKYIQPLDRGDFDMVAFLGTLRNLGYRGPIGLQCYGITGDAREHLARSMAVWRRLNGLD